MPTNSQLLAMINEPPPDHFSEDSKRLHRHYMAHIRDTLLLAGEDIDPADVERQLTAQMFGVEQEASDKLIEAIARGAMAAIALNVQQPAQAIRQSLHTAVHIAARVISESAEAPEAKAA